MFTDAQLATAMDCEGYIGINRMAHKTGRIQFSVYVGLAMCHPALPTALKVRFGGAYRLEHNPKGNYELHRWCLVGNKQTGPMLSALLPHLVVKKAQAANCLAFLEAFVQQPRPHRNRPRTSEDTEILRAFWETGKALNRPAPATTERENPVTGCYSLNSTETPREVSEVKLPIQ